MNDHLGGDASQHTPLRVPITPTAEGEAVWQGLRETWLTLRSMVEADDAVGGAFMWTASRYRPMVVYSQQGRALLAFSDE